MMFFFTEVDLVCCPL